MKRSFLLRFAIVTSLVTLWACGGEGPGTPVCGSQDYRGGYVIPGPGEEGYDASLALLARRYDRQFHVFNAAPMGVNVESHVSLDRPDMRTLMTDFLTQDDSFDFETYSGGVKPMEVTDHYYKVAGLYAGAGIGADAMRYAVLRDQGADCGEIETARQQLLRALDGLHVAFAITGTPGVVARGFTRTDISGDGQTTQTTPLFDDQGNPLPLEKDNGTWREDLSGLYPNYIWEDSCSRDMMLGWAFASAVAMEVMEGDPAIDESYRQRIREDSRAVVHELMKVRESGYDLEFPDADGRTTYHGYLNENSIERDAYMPGFRNGFYAVMALGIVGAFTYASGDLEAREYLYQDLIVDRELADIALEDMLYMNMGSQSNYSNYSMAFMAAFLAMRYIDDPVAREKIKQCTLVELYDTPGETYQPKGAQMSLYDFIVITALLGESAFGDLPLGEVDSFAFEDAIAGLKGFMTPPYWDLPVEQCDEAELESGVCTLENGTVTTVLNEGGRKGSTVCTDPVPKAIRRPSNYEWRSNPYNPNGGSDGAYLNPGVDFRVAYWLGRFLKTSK